MADFNLTQLPVPVKLEPIESQGRQESGAEKTAVIPPISSIPYPPRWMTLQGIIPKNYYNVACQVIGICVCSNNETVLRVWDGTEPRRKYMRSPEFDDGILTTLDHEANAQIFDYSVDVRVYDAFADPAAQIEIGQYVGFVNLHSYVNRDQQETLTLHGGDPALYKRFNRGIYSIPDEHVLSKALNARLKATYTRIENAANRAASN